MKHILVTRKNSDSHDYMRCDYYNGKWAQFKSTGRVLHSIVSAVSEEIKNSGGSVSVTFSSCRGGEHFINPENVSIEGGISTIVLVPVEDASGDLTQDSMRLWRAFIWSGPDSPPIKGEKIRQRTLEKWVSNFFDTNQLDNWKLPRGGSKTEVWIRPHWNVSTLLSGAPAKPIAEPVGEQPEILSVPWDAVTPVPVVDGKPVVRMSYHHKTRWRYTNIDGTTEEENIKSKEEAKSKMEAYLRNNNLRLPEMAT